MSVEGSKQRSGLTNEKRERKQKKTREANESSKARKQLKKRSRVLYVNKQIQKKRAHA